MITDNGGGINIGYGHSVEIVRSEIANNKHFGLVIEGRDILAQSLGLMDGLACEGFATDAVASSL